MGWVRIKKGREHFNYNFFFGNNSCDFLSRNVYTYEFPGNFIYHKIVIILKNDSYFSSSLFCHPTI